MLDTSKATRVRRLDAAEPKQYPISELFGPTRQGEGPQAGMWCYFCRLRTCDWDCEWCDTKYAVSPKYPGWNNLWMTAAEIVARLREIGAESGDWIILSGGNPALFVDQEFTSTMIGAGFKMSMETQGSRLLDEFSNRAIGCLIVSPKPPSSKMDGRFVPEVVVNLISNREKAGMITACKFVAFDHVDLDWMLYAKGEIERVALREKVDISYLKWYLSAGTPLSIAIPDRPEGLSDIDKVRLRVCDGITDLWLTTLADKDKRFKDVTILGQIHSLVWGQRAGV